MKTEFDIRLKSFNRSLTLLDVPKNVAVWKDQAPEIFTTKQGEAVIMVAALEEAAMNQEAGLGGVAEEKDREETELEDAAFVLSQALGTWFTDQKHESDAGEVDLTISDWRQMRDQRLLAKSQRVIDLAKAVVAGPDGVAAAKYGVTTEAVTTLTKERADYDHIVNAPGVAQSLRRALTKGFRPAFNLVESKFKELDSLIIQFGRTEEGRSMIAAWKDARLKKGAGHTGSGPETAKPGVPPESAVTPAPAG
ncbi:MAG: hypothetical protein V4726_10935 [Verrucomicrobiota bacterium]